MIYNPRPMTAQHSRAKWVRFRLPNHAHAGAFQPKIKPANPGEQTANG